MPVFNISSGDAQRFEAFREQAGLMAERCTDAGDAEKLRLFAKRFKEKTDDFFGRERRLNIGIVGQVKAGKSSFLNTLLFDGRPVLPKASTPKTAVLTKIEYAEDNAIEIEYYSPDDWEAITGNANEKLDGEVYESARELVRMSRESGADTDGLLAKGREKIPFGSYDELTGSLNNYVGENGKYTALVKAVVLYVNNPLFQELSIVDTPGLNDPIVSRTLRTKDFIEVCDVVFFLTPCGSFLDKSDWTLLSSQLPQKGVKRLVLVGSKFDSGLRDVLRRTDPNDPFGEDPNTRDNIPAAIELVRRKLTTRALGKVAEFEQRLRGRGAGDEIISVVAECRKPVFASSVAQNMVSRAFDSYDPEERNVYSALAEFSADLPGELAGVGNFAEVRTIRDEVAAAKEAILQKKCSGFIPAAREELLGLLRGFMTRTRERLTEISGGSRQRLLAKKDDIHRRINKIRSDVQVEVGEWLVRVEEKKAEGVKELRAAAADSRNIENRTGTEAKTGRHKVSDSKWYNPFSWWSFHYETYTYEESYSYVAVSDAVDSVRRFVRESEERIEDTFTEAVKHREMKRRLLGLVAANFDMSDEKYDSSYFRSVVESYINGIEFHSITMDCGEAVDSIASRFSGNLRAGREQDELKRALADAVDIAFNALIAQFERSAARFKASLSAIGDELQDILPQKMNEEFDVILKDLDDKDASIARLKSYADELEDMMKEVTM